MTVGRDLHSVRPPDIKTVVERSGDDLDAAPAEHIDNGDGLDLLEAVRQRNENLSHNRLSTPTPSTYT